MAHVGAGEPGVVTAYLRVLNGHRRMHRLLDAVIDGCFLGLMGVETLAALDRAFYADALEAVDGVARRYEDEQHITSGLQPWEHAAVTGAFPPGARVVVTGAGAGREVVALLSLGFDPVGYEPNARLVAAGQRLLEASGEAQRLRPCRRSAFPRDATRADAVLVGWGSYMLMPGRARRTAFLRAAREVLGPGGPLLLSFFPRPESRHLAIVHAVGNALRRARRDEALELGDALSPNFVHYFTRDEIEQELAAGGFACVSYAAQPYGHAVARAV